VSDDARWMGLALDMARRGAGRTAPNPMVGAVIVRDGEVLAEGFTQPPGQAHAEPHALGQIGAKAAGATMYVTLEPCCHWGRTPPCTDAILASGLRRVVVGTVDPFPLVAGKGIARLREAGVEVTVGVREGECRRVNLGFLRGLAGGLPEVTLKAATTLDGRIAADDGASRWITGPAAREDGHRLRDTHDAVLVGIGTVLADNPALTTRLRGGRDAIPVVLDTELRIPADARVLHGAQRAVVLCAEDAKPRDLRADVLRVPRGPGGLDVRAALRALAARGLHRVLAEGGGRVHRALLDADAVDRVELYVNARVLGGARGVFAGPGYTLADAPSFRFVAARPLGDDLHVTLERSTDGGGA
jgi:diaminohydroxyphosphoribosylaminopyrimidine deaminase/5-amino-6-(5-phosphoribosylamino)uracil reductase